MKGLRDYFFIHESDGRVFGEENRLLVLGLV